MSATFKAWEEMTIDLSKEDKLKGFERFISPSDKSLVSVSTSELVESLPEESKAVLAIETMKQLGRSKQEEIAKALSIPAPLQGRETNRLWTIFVSVLSAIFVLGAISLMIGMFRPLNDSKYIVSPETIFTVWSTVTAYLVGLFSLSPSSTEKK